MLQKSGKKILMPSHFAIKVAVHFNAQQAVSGYVYDVSLFIT